MNKRGGTYCARSFSLKELDFLPETNKEIDAP